MREAKIDLLKSELNAVFSHLPEWHPRLADAYSPFLQEFALWLNPGARPAGSPKRWEGSIEMS
jgi:hypothetical protein